MKRRLRDIIGDSDDDDDEDDGDARKNWSELSRSRKKQLLGKISTQMSKLAGERGTGVVNIAASLNARFQIIISIWKPSINCVYLFWGYVEIVILDVGLTLKDEITFEELRWFQGLSIEGAHIYYTVHE